MPAARQEPLDVRLVVSAVQRHPDVAVAEAPPSPPARGRPQRRRRARRAGRDGETAPVQRVQQGLAVDVQAGERHQVRQPVDRVADHLDVRHRRRHPSADPVHQRGSRAASAAASPARRPQRRRCRHHRRQVERPDARPPSRSSPGTATPTARPCAPPAARPRAARPTCARWRSAPTSRRYRRRPDRLRGVHVSGTPASAHAPRGPVTGWTVPTSWLARSARPAPPPGPDRRRPTVQVEPAQPVHRYGRRRAAAASAPGGVQHRRVLDRGVDQGRPDPPPAGQARRVRRSALPRTAGGEGEFVGADAQGLRGAPRGRRRGVAGRGAPACRAGRDLPSRRRGRPAAPAGRPGAAARRWPRPGRPGPALDRVSTDRDGMSQDPPVGAETTPDTVEPGMVE